MAVAIALHREPTVAVALHAERATVRLDDGLERLRGEFNALAGRPRLLAVLSPACPVCYAGAHAVADEWLDSGAGLAALVVWSEILPFDVSSKVGRRIDFLASHAGAYSFHDPRQIAARRVGELLAWPGGGPAWDAYLFYPADAVWEAAERPPAPAFWIHQHHEIEDGRYRTGEDLRKALREAAARLARDASASQAGATGSGHR